MKKFAIIIALLFCALFLAPTSIGRAFAVNTSPDTTIEQTTKDFIKSQYLDITIKDDTARFYNRTAGTSGEKDFALYLQSFMDELGYTPNGSDQENPAFDYFEFTSAIDNLTYRSQNIKFIKNGTSSEKKVIICTSYDNAFGFASGENSLEIIGEDASLNNVLVTLAIAKALNSVELNFDIEFIFFGAGYHQMAGSRFFTRGIDNKAKEKILLALNIDDLSDTDLYLYDAEQGTAYGKWSEATLKADGLNINKYKAGNSLISSSSEIYPFTHRALLSDNIAFLESGVRTLSVLTADKSGYFSNEYCKVVKSEKFIAGELPAYLDRAADVANSLTLLLTNANFVSNMTGDVKASSFLTDARYAVLLMLIAVSVMVVLYYVLYHKMFKTMKKKYSAGDATKLLGEKVDEEIDKSGNAELDKRRQEIKNIFNEDLKNKIDDEKDKEE